MKTITLCGLLLLATLMLPVAGCSTAPKEADQADFMVRARSSTTWFKNNVSGLSDQIANSSGYIIFPDVAQWGILFGGGTAGRGALMSPEGHHLGWAAINRGSIGLQAGVQGFRMLMVIQNDATLEEFKSNRLSGSASGQYVAGDAGRTGSAPFDNGVVIYQGANSGLMAGASIGLKYVRFQPLTQ